MSKMDIKGLARDMAEAIEALQGGWLLTYAAHKTPAELSCYVDEVAEAAEKLIQATQTPTPETPAELRL